jgi:hypothetical protein
MSWEQTLSPDAGWINPRLGTRFNEAGRFLHESGNTVVCQVIPGSPTETALLQFRAALADLPQADLLALTPPESWHMTVFEGVVEARRDPRRWPEGLATDMPIPAVTATMTARLDGFAPPPPFRMAVAAATPFGVTLRGLTPADETAARQWRDRLSETLRLRAPAHDDYAFHTTLAYVKRALPTAALPVWRATMAEWTARLQDELPQMDLARPAFCTFDDMCAFPPIRPLA